MKRRVVEILRENHLTYMRDGREVFTHIEEKDGMRYVTRPEVPLTLEIEEGYEDLGEKVIADDGDKKHEGFKRPTGFVLGMQICEPKRNKDNQITPYKKRIEEAKHKVYIGILLGVCKFMVNTENKIQICTEIDSDFYIIKGWLKID